VIPIKGTETGVRTEVRVVYLEEDPTSVSLCDCLHCPREQTSQLREGVIIVRGTTLVSVCPPSQLIAPKCELGEGTFYSFEHTLAQ
jgi:hypothetical protein